jgi:predicted transcriptional regulator
MNTDLIKGIAQSDYRKNLTLYLKEVQTYVADIRNGTYDNDVRKATIEAIQKLVIDKLHTLSGEVVSSSDDYK